MWEESLMQQRRSLRACRPSRARHQVGRVSFDWVDPDRAEIYSSNPQDRRELVIWAWYPAAPGPRAERAAYLPEPWAPAGQLFGLDAAGLQSHAVADAPLADERSSYPVLVLSPAGSRRCCWPPSPRSWPATAISWSGSTIPMRRR
jgi:hypothetical protein